MVIEKEIHTYYQKEKENLIAQLGNLTSRVCFSIGIMIETGWVSITAHFINDDYNLVKRLIGFKKLHVSELKNAVTNVIESCISDWKLKDKIFTFTIGEDLESFDNVLRMRFDKKMLLRAHEMFISCSREELARIYFYYLKSECSVEKDQIINLLRDVLENGSKYGRLNEIARKMGLPPINKDWLKGQPAGWCAGTQVWKFCCFVVKMFKEALLYKDVFCQHALAVPRRIDNPFMLKIDPHCINWSKVEDAVKCFERIDPVIGILPSFKFPTSNLYIQNLTNLNEILTRFGGFYSCRPICCIGCVLDPRYKLIFLEYVFHRDEFVVISQGTTFGEVINIFHSLFRIYANEEKTNQVIPLPIGTANPQNEGPSINSTNTCPSIIIDDLNLYVKQSKHAKREMYEYLMEATADIEETNFDLLGWWKENGLRYPVLCRMARDVLAMPDCIYDYEKGLNIDLSILEGVSPELAEAVICSKDWILSDV
jgi:hAT family C-terminal dimerisation region